MLSVSAFDALWLYFMHVSVSHNKRMQSDKVPATRALFR
jgi:hypothetical protein